MGNCCGGTRFKSPKSVAQNLIPSFPPLSSCHPYLLADPSSSSPFSALPPDIIALCLARLPAKEHAALKAVSRQWRSIVCSEEFNAVRTNLKLREQWLVVAASENSSSEKFVLKLRIFDCTHCTWLSLPLPKELHGMGAGFGMEAVGQQIFIFGGQQKRQKISNQTWAFDFRTCQWRRCKDMNVGRRFPATGAIGGQILAAGGYVEGDDDIVLTERYSPETDEWHELPSSGVPAIPLDGWVVRNKLYVHLADRVYVVSPQANSENEAMKIIPNSRHVDPVLVGMHEVLTVNGRVYGTMLSSHLASIGVFHEEKKRWHLLVAQGPDVHGIFDKYCGMVGAGGKLFVVTHDSAVLEVEMDSEKNKHGAPRWMLLSHGSKQRVHFRWRKIACLEL